MENYSNDWMPSSSMPEGSMIQLSNADAIAYMKSMLKRSEIFKQLHDEFTKQGFKFIFERAKVFMYSTVLESDDKDTAPAISANVLGILPSYILTSAAEPYHQAVSISVHNSGYALATSVRVDHKPFGITEFTLHELNSDRKIISNSMKADELESGLQAHQLAEKLGAAAPAKVSDKNHATPHPGDQATMVAITFSQLQRDKYVRPLYPIEGARALMAQIPLMQQFGNAAYARFGGRFPGGLSINLCTSSSTSSNVCTSTSTSSIEL